MFFPFFDPTMLIVLPGLLLAIYAQFKVKSAFYHYSRVPSERGMTGGRRNFAFTRFRLCRYRND